MIVLISCKEKPIIDDTTHSVFPNAFLSIMSQQEIYVTSFGQSIDIEDFSKELDFLDVPYTRDNYLTANDIEANAVVVMVVGSSIKGLQSAGITNDMEIKRAQEIFNIKQSHNLTILAFHLGGVARRGSTSDGIIFEIMSKTDFNIAYLQGNYDRYLSNISKEANIPFYTYEYQTQLLPTLKKLVGGEES